ncbi:MAG: glycosyltransferase [Phocaeicola sp.]
MKKNIFIAMHYLEIGGAEISLIGLLNAIDYTHYDVDLFIYSHQGELMPLIPQEVNLLPEVKRYAMLERPMKEVLKYGYIDLLLGRVWAKKQCRQFMRKNKLTDSSSIFQYIAHNTTPLLPNIAPQKEYDLAISFLTPHNIVRDRVKSKKKIAWIHTDYSNIVINAPSELPVWSAYNYIASISEEVTTAFLKVFPTLKEKIVLIENILSPTFVRNRADEKEVTAEMEVAPGALRFLSIGRYCYPKNFDNVPFIAKALVEKGLKFTWFLIGYGGDESLIKENIKKAGVEGVVILLGKRANPYPYLKATDIYLQPSRYEGKSVSVREAQMLCKPVIVSNYPTAASQIKQGIDGYIVPLENEAFATGVLEFVKNKALQQQITEHLTVTDFGNEAEIVKIEELIK